MQTELKIHREREPDRNHALGGRSFYFFDFDDNIASLGTHTYVFHRKTGEELGFSSSEWAKFHALVGKPGPLADYEISFCEKSGSFRRFRDQVAVGSHQSQGFVQDLLTALEKPAHEWQGPSWTCFYHAVFNQRPIALITARGHHPQTIISGLNIFKEKGHLPTEPNYLGVYPVSYPETKRDLGRPIDHHDVAELKQAAIRAAVEKAFRDYGYSPHHRFGMSDDDPRNLQLIRAEMQRIKRDYPDNSFFVISTHGGEFVKTEMFVDHTQETPFETMEQLSLMSVDSQQPELG